MQNKDKENSPPPDSKTGVNLFLPLWPLVCLGLHVSVVDIVLVPLKALLQIKGRIGVLGRDDGVDEFWGASFQDTIRRLRGPLPPPHQFVETATRVGDAM